MVAHVGQMLDFHRPVCHVCSSTLTIADPSVSVVPALRVLFASADDRKECLVSSLNCQVKNDSRHCCSLLYPSRTVCVYREPQKRHWEDDNVMKPL